MRRTFAPLGLLLFLFALSGCASLEWAAPEVSGRVVDAQSHAPLAHVAIYREVGGKAEPVGQTDADGRFRIAPKKKMYVSSPLAEGQLMRGASLEFVLAGYAPAYFDCSTYTSEAQASEHPLIDSVVIELHAAAPEPAHSP